MGARTLVCSVCLLLVSITSPVTAQDIPACSEGFTATTQNGERVTCQFSQTVADASLADTLASKFLRSGRCIGGKATDRKSGIGDSGDGSWLVIIRFLCGPRE